MIKKRKRYRILEGNRYCTKCSNTGLAEKKVNGEVVITSCQCKIDLEKTELWTRRLIDSRIPRDYWHLSIKHYKNFASSHSDYLKNRASLRRLKFLLTRLDSKIQSGEGLYLSGDNNSGKTMFMSCILKAAIAKGYKVKFYTMEEVISWYMSNWFEYDNSIKKDINIFKEQDILGIDDCFDREKVYIAKNKMQITQLDDLFRFMVSNWKCFIVTANPSMKEVEGSFNRSILSCLQRKLVELKFRGSISKQLQTRLIKKLEAE